MYASACPVALIAAVASRQPLVDLFHRLLAMLAGLPSWPSCLTTMCSPRFGVGRPQGTPMGTWPAAPRPSPVGFLGKHDWHARGLTTTLIGFGGDGETD